MIGLNLGDVSTLQWLSRNVGSADAKVVSVDEHVKVNWTLGGFVNGSWDAVHF